MREPKNIVLRVAAGPFGVGDWNFGDALGERVCERWYERRLLVACDNRVDNMTAIRAQHASVVMHRHADDHRGEAVLHPRGDPPVGAIAPLLAPSADDVVTFVDRLEQARNFLGGILPVGVERHYDLAAALATPGQLGRTRAESAGELDDPHARVGRGKLTENRKRIVGRAVVDEDHLEFAITSVDNGNEPPP